MSLPNPSTAVTPPLLVRRGRPVQVLAPSNSNISIQNTIFNTVGGSQIHPSTFNNVRGYQAHDSMFNNVGGYQNYYSTFNNVGGYQNHHSTFNNVGGFQISNSTFNSVGGSQINSTLIGGNQVMNIVCSPVRAEDDDAPSLKSVTGPGVKILTFDGGGFRGLASLYLLRAVMRRILPDVKDPSTIRPCEYFDLVCGTSAGGLVALLLGRLGMSIGQAIKTFEALGPTIFGHKWNWIPVMLGMKQRFDHIPLETELKKLCGETLLKGGPLSAEEDDGTIMGTHCFVTTVTKNTVTPQILRSYDVDRRTDASAALGDNNGWKIWEAARATSAAPLYFAPFRLMRDKHVVGNFVDAGLANVNNPTLLALEEKEYISALAGRPIDCLISIGTGTPGVYPSTNVPTRLARVVKNLVAAAANTENTAEQVAGRSDLEDKYFRFNPDSELHNLDFTDLMCANRYEPIVLAYANKAEVIDMMERCRALGSMSDARNVRLSGPIND